MEYPDIEVGHAKFLKRLEAISRALEERGVGAACAVAMGRLATVDRVEAAASACLSVFGGMPSSEEASPLARAAFVSRTANLAAGLPKRPDEIVDGHFRSVLRLYSCTPAMCEDGEMYSAVAEVLSGQLVGRAVGLGKVSARWVNGHFLRNVGGRAYRKYRAADAAGLFFTAWVSTRRNGAKALAALSASGSQQAWNRKLLDEREGPCRLEPGARCMPCRYGSDKCGLGRWPRSLDDGKCLSCSATAPLLPGGICLRCVYTGAYRSVGRPAK